MAGGGVSGESLQPIGSASSIRRCKGEDFPGETLQMRKGKGTRRFGEYRTMRLVLEAWERLA